MLMSVLERRPATGLRRALGATRRHVVTRFPVVSLVLAGLAGSSGGTRAGMRAVFAPDAELVDRDPPIAILG
jgi:putative ABC transport system permease protein